MILRRVGAKLDSSYRVFEAVFVLSYCDVIASMAVLNIYHH